MNSNDNIKRGDIFILSPSKGYSGKQIREGMQVMELWDGCMTVKCTNGCMDKPYEFFDRVDENMKIYKINYSEYFEDNRKK